MFNPQAVILTLASALMLAACGEGLGSGSQVEWFLDPADSTVTFISVKNGDVVESNRFGAVNGAITRAGYARVEIQAASVDTGIDTRDDRLRRHIFATDEHPLVTIETNVDLAGFRDLAGGESRMTDLELNVTVAGRTNTHFANVRVTRTSRGRVIVSTIAPVLIDARDYRMEDGIATLAELASLDAITPVFPVSVHLVFARS